MTATTNERRTTRRVWSGCGLALAAALAAGLAGPAAAGPISALDVLNNWSQVAGPRTGIKTGSAAVAGSEVRIFGPGGEPNLALISDFTLGSGSTFSGSMRTTQTADDDAFGFVFGWQDGANHHRFAWDAFDLNDGLGGLLGTNGVANVSGLPTTVHGKRFLRESGGVTTYLLQDPGPDGAVPYQRNTLYNFAISRSGNDLSLFVEKNGGGVIVNSMFTDPTFANGRVGIFSESQSNVYFSNLAVSTAPEPATLALALLGIAGVARRRR